MIHQTAIVGLVVLSLVSTTLAATAPSAATAAGDVTASFEGRLGVVGPAVDGWEKSVRLLLNSGERTVFVRAGGLFRIDGLEAGVHLLEVQSPTHIWDAVRVQVSAQKKGKVSARFVNPLTDPYAGKNLELPLEWISRGAVQYKEVQQGFGLNTLLANPMIMIMLFMAGMMFVMPKLMAGIDPEELRQQQELGIMGMLTGGDEAINALKQKKKDKPAERKGPKTLAIQ